MLHKPNTSAKSLIAASVAAAFGLSAGAAFAQTTTPHTSHDEALANSTTARQVTLTDRQNAQTLQYSRARNLRICNLSGQGQSAAAAVHAEQQRAPDTRPNLAISAPASAPNPVALQVSYAGMSEQIQPGNCYDFRARSVRLSPATALPAGTALSVSIARVSPRGFVNGRTEAYSGSSRDTRRSVKELKEQLKRDDEQEQQANAELSQARDKLAQTSRQLKQAQSQERHVASAEHRTTDAAHQEQQNVQRKQQNVPENQQNQQNEGTPR